MEHKARKALIAGATGLVGSYLLQQLLNSDYYTEVVALVRRPLAIKHEKLKTVQTNFSDFDGLEDAFLVNDVYVCLGTTIKKAESKKAFKKVDREYPYEIALKAHQMGANRFAVISALGADTNSKFFYSRVKGKMEDLIEGIPFKGTYIFRPSLLLGPRKEFRFGEKVSQVANEIFKHVLVGKLSKYKGVKAEHVATAMMHAVISRKKGLHFIESDQIRKIAKGKQSL